MKNKNNKRKSFALAVIIVTFIVCLILLNHTDGLKDNTHMFLLQNWIKVELTSVIAEPIYYYFLHKIINFIPRADKYIFDTGHDSTSNENATITKI